MCSDSTGHQHSLPVFEASADVFCFFFSNMAAASEQSAFFLLRDEHSLWWHEDQSNPDFTHASDDTYMKGFFFPHIQAHMMNLEWLSNCRGCKDSDTL